MELSEKYARAFAAIQNMRLGMRVLRACREAGISRTQLYELASSDENVKNALTVAEDECNAILAESLVDANEWGFFGAQDPKIATVWAKNAQWLLARADPAKYGDKIVVENKTTVDVIITQRLEAAKQRIGAIDRPIIDITPSKNLTE